MARRNKLGSKSPHARGAKSPQRPERKGHRQPELDNSFVDLDHVVREDIGPRVARAPEPLTFV